MEGLCQSSPSRHHGRRTARADTETAVLLAGPGTVINTSDAGGELTAEARAVIRCWLVCRLPIMCSGVASADAALAAQIVSSARRQRRPPTTGSWGACQRARTALVIGARYFI